MFTVHHLSFNKAAIFMHFCFLYKLNQSWNLVLMLEEDAKTQNEYKVQRNTSTVIISINQTAPPHPPFAVRLLCIICNREFCATYTESY